MLNRIAAATVAGALMAAPALAETVTIDTARGPVEVEAQPQSLVVLDMAALDTLDALGVNVADSVAPIYLPRLKQYEGDAGTLFEPNFEALAALSPDLIVAGGRSAAQVDALARLAPTVDMTFPGDDILNAAVVRVAEYGKLFGKDTEAAALAAAIETQIEATKAAVDGKGDALILMTNGNKVSAYGSGSRFGWLHHELGIPEAVENVDTATHGEAISFEFIREADPEWLIVVDRVSAINAEGDSAQVTLDNPLVRETRAWQDGHVIYLNAGEIYLADGGANSVLTTLKTLEEGFGGADQ